MSGYVSITAQGKVRPITNLYWVMWISMSKIPLIFLGMLPVRSTLKLLVILNWNLQVSVRIPLKSAGFRTGTESTVTFCVTPIERTKFQASLQIIGESNPTYHPPVSETQDDKVIRMDRALSLAAYIISHPIPEGWELRRNKSGHGVYFFNLATSKHTSMMWFDPLY
jgi:hypothetical protein